MAKTDIGKLLSVTAEIVAAHVSNNFVSKSDLPALITEVYRTLSSVGSESIVLKPESRKEPAVSIKKSITPDYLISLEDGKKVKMLKRHLRTTYGLTPDQYREKWGLSADYPMVAPNYAARRSMLAKEIGLGSTTRRGPARAKTAVQPKLKRGPKLGAKR